MDVQLNSRVIADWSFVGWSFVGERVDRDQRSSYIASGARRVRRAHAPGFTAGNLAQLPGISDEQQTCLGRGVLETITLTVWAQTTVATPEIANQLRGIAEGCDVDPRLVLPLVGG